MGRSVLFLPLIIYVEFFCVHYFRSYVNYPDNVSSIVEHISTPAFKGLSTEGRHYIILSYCFPYRCVHIISLYCKPSNTTHLSRVSSIKLTGRHVSVYRRPSSGPQKLQLVICNVIFCNVMGTWRWCSIDRNMSPS